MANERSRSKPSGLPIIHPFAAGIDLGSRFHVAAVSPELCDEPVQTFQAFTSDLERMASWLVATGTKTVVMESTGVYWVAAFEVLESHGLEVILANAREARAVPGRKSDVNDAQWLQRLHACGLLRASFRPGRDIAELRSYLRAREKHTDYAAAHIQHMQKALTFMNIQLHHVIATITGVTGMRIIRAIVAGERNPDTLAAIARCALQGKHGNHPQCPSRQLPARACIRPKAGACPLRFLPAVYRRVRRGNRAYGGGAEHWQADARRAAPQSQAPQQDAKRDYPAAR